MHLFILQYIWDLSYQTGSVLSVGHSRCTIKKHPILMEIMDGEGEKELLQSSSTKMEVKLINARKERNVALGEECWHVGFFYSVRKSS
jgi:hypothetical protein